VPDSCSLSSPSSNLIPSLDKFPRVHHFWLNCQLLHLIFFSISIVFMHYSILYSRCDLSDLSIPQYYVLWHILSSYLSMYQPAFCALHHLLDSFHSLWLSFLSLMFSHLFPLTHIIFCCAFSFDRPWACPREWNLC